MLTPLSLQYHNHNMLNQSHTLNNHHHRQLGHHHQPLPQHQALHPNHLGAPNGGDIYHQPTYSTTHRTFPAAQPADLSYSSLNRKKFTGGGVNGHHHMNTADIMDTGSNGGSTGRRANPSLFYADLVHGHPQNNGKSRHNGYAGTNGSVGGGMIHSNGYISGNGGVPIARPPQLVGSMKMNGDHIMPHHNSKHQDIPLIAPGTGNGTGPGFPVIRGSEINV